MHREGLKRKNVEDACAMCIDTCFEENKFTRDKWSTTNKGKDTITSKTFRLQFK